MAEGGFWQSYRPDPRLAAAYNHILDAIEVYRAAKRPTVAAQLQLHFDNLLRNVQTATENDARAADAAIRDKLRERLVRDETQGPHLASRVLSIAEPAFRPEGALGIASLDELDQAVDPDYPQSPYWRAIEYGSSAAVGRIVVGYFQPGFAVPEGGQSRQHPMFMSQAASGFMAGMSGAPAMRVTRPIEAKHFLRDGADEVLVRHEKSMRTLQAESAAAMLASTA